MTIEIREMALEDYDAVAALWRETPGVFFRAVTDSRQGIERLLARNPGLSFVALDQQRVVGSLLGSHDGRRGYLQHVVVTPAMRGQGIAGTMIERCLAELRRHHLGWVHLDVAVENETGKAFWERAGWGYRNELTRLSRQL